MSHVGSQPPGPAPLHVAVDVTTGRVTLAGELDREAAPVLADALQALLACPSASWTVDAGAVTCCDAAGLRALLGVHEAASARGRSFVLVDASSAMQRLITLVGLADTLPPAVPPPARPTARLPMEDRRPRPDRRARPPVG